MVLRATLWLLRIALFCVVGAWALWHVVLPWNSFIASDFFARVSSLAYFPFLNDGVVSESEEHLPGAKVPSTGAQYAATVRAVSVQENLTQWSETDYYFLCLFSQTAGLLVAFVLLPNHD